MPRTRIRFPLVQIAVACLLLWAGLLLAAPLSVSGRVLGPDGEPMSVATALLSYLSTEPWRVVVSHTTDDTGAFSFSVDEAAPYELVNVAAMRPGHCITWATVAPGARVDLQLSTDSVTCRGVCVDTAGEPLPNAIVTVTEIAREHENHWSQMELWLSLPNDSPITTTAGENGAFSIPHLPPGSSIRIQASADGCEKRTRDQIPADAEGIRVYLRPEAIVSGRVTYNGAAVADASVVIGSWPKFPAAQTAADGSFMLKGLSPGRYTVEVNGAPDGLMGDWLPEVELAAGQTVTNLDIPLTEPAIVRGTFADKNTGDPVGGVRLYAYVLEPTPRIRRGWEVWSGPEGRYELRVPPGDVSVYPRVRIDEDPLWWTIDGPEGLIRIKSGEVHEGIDFTVNTEPTVTGTVIDPDGKPVPDAEVGSINRGWAVDVLPREFFCARSDESGAFAIQAIEGIVRKGYHSWGFIARDIPRGLAGMAMPDAIDDPIEIRLRPAAWLLSRVVNRDGEPVPGVPVGVKIGELGEYSDMARTMPGAVSDEEGFVRIGPIPPETYCTIELGGSLRRFFFNENQIGAEMFCLDPGEERQLLPIIFDPRGRSVSGIVVDANGDAVRDALVFGDSTVTPAITGVDGQFTLSGLPKDGMVDVQAVHPTEALFAGATVDPDYAPLLTLQLGPAAGVSGRAIDADGRPVTTMTASLHRTPPAMVCQEIINRQSEAGRRLYGYVDGDGTWALWGFIGGIEYSIALHDRDRKFNSHVLTFTAESGVTTDLGDIILQKK